MKQVVLDLISKYVIKSDTVKQLIEKKRESKQDVSKEEAIDRFLVGMLKDLKVLNEVLEEDVAKDANICDKEMRDLLQKVFSDPTLCNTSDEFDVWLKKQLNK